MAGYKVEICGVNTSDLPLLKPAQAKELLVKIKSGDTQARETFIKGNLRLVLSIVPVSYTHLTLPTTSRV